jgi:hypothetical protein
MWPTHMISFYSIPGSRYDEFGMFAWLNANCEKKDWQCYGMQLLGIYPQASVNIPIHAWTLHDEHIALMFKIVFSALLHTTPKAIHDAYINHY